MYYAPEFSGSGPYTADLAEHLVACGYKVTVVTTHPHYPDWRRPPGIKNWFKRDVIAGVRVLRVPTYVPRRPSIGRRALYEASFAALAGVVSSFVKADLIIGTSPGLFGATVSAVTARLRRRPLLVVVQDVVSSAPAQTGQASESSLTTRILRRMEGATLGSADVVTVPTDAFRATLQNLKVDDRHVVTVRNWSRVTLDVNGDPKKRREEMGWQGRYVILHTGNIGFKQGLEEFSSSMREIERTHPEILFVFVGAGNKTDDLRRSVQGLSNIQLLAPVPNALYSATLLAADALLVHEASGVSDISLPSKLTSYFATGRPVIAICRPGGATASEVERSGGGLVCGQGDIEALHAALQSLASPPLVDALARNGKAYWTDELAPESQLPRVAAIVDGLVDLADPAANCGVGR